MHIWYTMNAYSLHAHTENKYTHTHKQTDIQVQTHIHTHTLTLTLLGAWLKASTGKILVPHWHAYE